MSYNYKEIEKKWQNKWEKEGTFYAENNSSKKKWYGLIEFPYPSGQGLHVGHPRSYTAMDIVARKRRMQGYNVLFPIGFDAFGLPAENFAIKNHIHPKIVTEQNIANFTRQLKSIGFSFDWSRVINTTDPEYYKWTQWIFIQLYKHGLAYKATMPINFCTGCKVGLSNEEVVNGVCERCGSPVVQKEKSQWMLKITDYAQRLIDDLDDVDFLEKIKIQQRNWIGRSEGAELDFSIADSDEKLRVYTTRPDTLFGATYMVVAPEHHIIEKLKDKITNLNEIKAYQTAASLKSDFERSELNKDKTGVEIKGIKAINPATGKEIPIWVSDYVLITYGTGAIMAVPAHDERDYAFATKFGLDIVPVIEGGDVSKEAYSGDGVHINSDFLNGMNKQDAIAKMISWIEEKGIGTKKVNYKLRDWVFSRQRYWGEPIPMVHCDKCGWVPVPEDQLPLVLPDVKDYEPGENGESPLAKHTEWTETTCPHCGGHATRETDTMPQWAGSSWYFLRYCDPNNNDEFASQEALKYWMPVDWYNGGMEHVTRHMIYSRFWHKFLYDLGLVPTSEPYAKRTAQGLILGPDGEKMSKSRGNVVDPNDVVDEYGADVLRLYVLFMGDYEKAAPWSESSVKGCKRFVDRIWALQDKVVDSDEYSDKLRSLMHKTIKKVSDDIESMKFNTAIAAMMTLLNEIYNVGSITKKEFRDLLIILNPFAPHVTEELYQMIGCEGVLDEQEWVTYDEALCKDDTIEIVCQINGKVKSKLTIPTDAAKDDVIALAKADEAIVKATEGKNIVKEIYVPNKLVNLVVK